MDIFGYSWTVDGPWGAPGGGTFDTSNVAFTPNSVVLKMTQTVNPDGSVTSSDAEICSKSTFGYGTFEFRMAADPIVSGQVASGFLFINNSETEIDVELTGDDRTIWFTNYAGISNKEYSSSTGIPQDQFHDYKIVWTSVGVSLFIDGVLQTTHIFDVPKVPAYFLFNLWGTNSKYWGGMATPGTRQLFVTHFKYTPA